MDCELLSTSSSISEVSLIDPELLEKNVAVERLSKFIDCIE